MNDSVVQIKDLIDQLEYKNYDLHRINEELNFLNDNKEIAQVVLDLILIKKDYFNDNNILLVKGEYSNLYIFYIFGLILTNPLNISVDFNMLFKNKIILKTNDGRYLKQCIKLKKKYTQVIIDKFRPLSQSIDITTHQYPDYIFEKNENIPFFENEDQRQLFDYSSFLNDVKKFKEHILSLYNDYLISLNIKYPHLENKDNYISYFIFKIKNENNEYINKFFYYYPDFFNLLIGFIKEPIGVIELNRLALVKDEKQSYINDQGIYKKDTKEEIVLILTEDDKLKVLSKYLFVNKISFKEIQIDEYKPQFYKTFLNYSCIIKKEEKVEWVESNYENINDYNLKEIIRIYVYDNYKEFEKEIPINFIKLFNNVPIYIEDIKKCISDKKNLIDYYNNYELLFKDDDFVFLKKYLKYNRIIFKNENLQELEIYYMLFYYTYVIEKHSALAILNYFE